MIYEEFLFEIWITYDMIMIFCKFGLATVDV